MKAAWSMMLGLVAILALVVVSVQADDKDKDKDKEKTLKGTILCGKCELKKTDECTNAIRVKDDKTDKEVIYYFDDKGREESYHKTICQKPKEGSVKGTISEKDGKMYIKPAKDGVKFKEKDKDKDKE